jgi:outer membrane protein TolC
MPHKRNPVGCLAALEAAQRAPGLAATLLASVSLTGCTVGPDFSAPARPTEQTYLPGPATAPGSADRGEIGQSVGLGGTLQADWWTRLGSPELDRTVALALSNNRTIDIARANLAKAGELVTAARGGLYPQVDAAAGLDRRQYGESFLRPLASPSRRLGLHRWPT